MSKKDKMKAEAPAEEEKPRSAAMPKPESAAEKDEKVAAKTEVATEKSKAGEEKKGETAAPKEPDWKALYALTLADFDNYKKRAARDREDTYRFAEADILLDVLPSVDNLALALASAKDQEDPFVKGVQLVYDTLIKALKDHGAEPFDSIGKNLDPEKMEAIATLPSQDVEEGKVSNEVKRGWMLKDKLLRAAQVVVSSGKAT